MLIEFRRRAATGANESLNVEHLRPTLYSSPSRRGSDPARASGTLTARAVDMNHWLRTIQHVLRRAGVAVLCLTGACRIVNPSTQIVHEVELPVPAEQTALPERDRLTSKDRGVEQCVTARSLIPLAFGLQPDIKSSFQRFRSESARYDFFHASRDSLTPRLRVSNDFDERRDLLAVDRSRTHTVELSLEKRFFDTSEVDVAVGMRGAEIEDDLGNAPFISADVRYPLWASREKLERASEDIFRRNELNDTQLAYIQEVRDGLQGAMFRFYRVVNLSRRLRYYDAWAADLDALRQRVEKKGQQTSVDASRLAAETTRVSSRRLDISGQYQMEMMHLKADLGLPFHVKLDLVDEPFNPFAGLSHEEVLASSVRSDPEIATLRNEVSNAEVQLDLARRGRWDIALLFSGDSTLEGNGTEQGVSDWTVMVGFDVSAVDPRVTDSLSRQAQSNIDRFKQAIAARENEIFADTFESLIRIETLGQSLDNLRADLPRFEHDYVEGKKAYSRGEFNIDDLLKRRELWFQQQQETARLRLLLGANVAELCASTGKFFEFLNVETNADARSDPKPVG